MSLPEPLSAPINFHGPSFKSAAEFQGGSNNISVIDASSGNPTPFELRSQQTFGASSFASFFLIDPAGAHSHEFYEQAYLKLHCKVAQLPSAGTGTICWFEDIGFNLRVGSDGSLRAWDGADYIAISPPNVIVEDVWYSIQVHVGSGQWVVRINDLEVLAGDDELAYHATPRLHLGGFAHDDAAATADIRYHSIVISPLTMPAHSLLVHTSIPAAEGTLNEWSVTGGANRADAIAEDQPDGHDSFIAATEAGQRQNIQCTAFPGAGQILAAKATWLLNADIFGDAVELRYGLRLGKDLDLLDVDDTVGQAATYRARSIVRDLTPAELPWDVNAFNSVTPEIQLAANPPFDIGDARCTAMRLTALVSPPPPPGEIVGTIGVVHRRIDGPEDQWISVANARTALRRVVIVIVGQPAEVRNAGGDGVEWAVGKHTLRNVNLADIEVRLAEGGSVLIVGSGQ